MFSMHHLNHEPSRITFYIYIYIHITNIKENQVQIGFNTQSVDKF